MAWNKTPLTTICRHRVRWCSCRFALVLVPLSMLCIPAGLIAENEDDDDVFGVPVAEPQIVITEQNFDQMVFGGRQAQVVRVANGVQTIEMVGSPTKDFRKRLEDALAAEIEVVERQFSLTESQKKKLRLAGKGDLHQFFSRVADLRRRCTAEPLSQQEWATLSLELQPLRMARATLNFGDTSLFWKTLRGTLSGDQRTRFHEYERQQQVKLLENVLLNWDRLPTAVRLAGASRQKFIEILVDQGRLPHKAGSYIHYVVLFEAARLEKPLRAALSDDEWDKLHQQVVQAKRYEAAVRNSGEWPVVSAEDDDAILDATKE